MQGRQRVTGDDNHWPVNFVDIADRGVNTRLHVCVAMPVSALVGVSVGNRLSLQRILVDSLLIEI